MSTDFRVWLAAFMTWGILSFLWKENPWYRFVEHVFVGIGVAHLAVVAVFNIKEMAVKPIVAGKWILVIPVLLGVLLYSRWVKGIEYLSRIPMAYIMGVTSSVVVTGTIKASFIDQVVASMRPVKTLNDLIFALCVVCATSYFLFSKKASTYAKPATFAGRWVLMVAFGAAFGYTVMSRISYFTARLQFLFGTWLKVIK